MKSLQERLAALSPEQRALFEQQVMRKTLSVRSERTAQQIPRRGHNRPSPLSFDQERLWRLHQKAPDLPTYNVYGAIRLSGTLHAGAMERAVNEIIRRHEAWRTVFRTVDGEVRQIVQQHLQLQMAEVDLTHLPLGEQEAAVQQVIGEEVTRPFDLETGPLLRVKLVRLAEGESCLVLTVHHLVTDRVSFSIVFEELTAHYRAFLQGAAPTLPEPAIQYADYAEWQHGYLTGEVREKLLGYWKHKLAGSAFVLQLPADFPRPDVQSHRGARVFFTIQKALAARLKALGQREGATGFMVLLAAFQVLLHKLSGQEDILVGTPVANRGRKETARVIGYFLTSSVLRTELNGQLSFWDVLRRVRETALEAFAHQELPFRLLHEALELPEDTSRNPVFQAMFVYVDVDDHPLQLPGLSIRYDLLDAGTAKYDLTVGLVEREGGLECFLEYSPDLFLAETVEEFAASWLLMLQNIIENPAGRICTF
ncbi:condensation domain-containing protein [Tumebacillus sp. BK434]|uniref:condensation domain-containing protein n=1 Tax=Tumebacillus sp. BK434 TaxID=2512169 RepID=UPI0010477678|nr:condensation domain-containing protein [Tumebacillus sp. BK434]TCP59045.1 condensation domain-containing protein [Tumebacillus sp. BK434]